MEIRIERLGPGDVARMRELNALMGAVFGEDGGDAYTQAPPGEAWLADLLNRPDVVALAAWRGGELAGALTAYELTKFEQERRELMIYDLAVAEAHRRQGVARALIAWTQAHAASRGAWVVFVQADLRDPPASALYSGLGTREEVLHFDLPVVRATPSPC
jgi:aminoglycoside 3-N-acetyltransferase I